MAKTKSDLPKGNAIAMGEIDLSGGLMAPRSLLIQFPDEETARLAIKARACTFTVMGPPTYERTGPVEIEPEEEELDLL